MGHLSLLFKIHLDIVDILDKILDSINFLQGMLIFIFQMVNYWLLILNYGGFVLCFIRRDRFLFYLCSR